MVVRLLKPPVTLDFLIPSLFATLLLLRRGFPEADAAKMFIAALASYLRFSLADLIIPFIFSSTAETRLESSEAFLGKSVLYHAGELAIYEPIIEYIFPGVCGRRHVSI